MRKFAGLMGIFMILTGLPGILGIISDRAFLSNQMIRLHVVGASDSEEDQNLKLQVKDAVTTYLHQQLAREADTEAAREYIARHLHEIKAAANAVLDTWGSDVEATVSFGREYYPQRQYASFTLPSGVYESLIVTIGEGRGKNWWCVVFPSLCAGTTVEEYENIAADAGLSSRLINTTVCDDGYEIRFFLLDCIGKLENLFHFR